MQQMSFRPRQPLAPRRIVHRRRPDVASVDTQRPRVLYSQRCFGSCGWLWRLPR